MALVLPACLIEGVLGVQPGTAGRAAERLAQAKQAPREPEHGNRDRAYRDIEQQGPHHGLPRGSRPLNPPRWRVRVNGQVEVNGGQRRRATAWLALLLCLVCLALASSAVVFAARNHRSPRELVDLSAAVTLILVLPGRCRGCRAAPSTPARLDLLHHRTVPRAGDLRQ